MPRWLGRVVVATCVGVGIFATSFGTAERAAVSCGKDGALRVMSYNIRTGLGLQSPGKNPLHLLFAEHDTAPVIAAIAAAEPDVVALQEVLGWGQARRIARALEMDHHFVFHPSPLPWWGTAILSKCDVSERTRVVTSRGKGNGKAMAVAQVVVEDVPVAVTSVHRDRDDNSGVQVQRMLAALPDGQAALLIGDFNFTPKDARHGQVTQRFHDTGEVAQTGREGVDARGTYPSVSDGNTPRRIDYVFASDHWDVTRVAVIEGSHVRASDHLPYVADIELKTKRN